MKLRVAASDWFARIRPAGPSCQERIVVVHRDDGHFRSRGSKRSENVGQIRRDRGDSLCQTDRIRSAQAEAMENVVATNVQRDERDLMRLKKLDGFVQLILARITADTAVDHCERRLA